MVRLPREIKTNDNMMVADIEGYGAVFHKPDLNGDVIVPGAFNRDGPVRMLYQHAAETPIGRWAELREDQFGLFVRGQIILSSPRAREVHALLAGGALDGLSIGYQTIRATKAKAGRKILTASLWEISVVTFPMAPLARISHVGSPRPEHRQKGNIDGAMGDFTTALRQATSTLSV